MSAIFDQHQRGLRRARADRMAGDDFLRDRALADLDERLAAMGRSFERRLAADTAGDLLAFDPASFDLVTSLGELETAPDPALHLFTLRQLLAPGGLLVGAIVGGDSLPALRGAMLAADRIAGRAAPRVHPMIDGPSLAGLLQSVGFVDPVVDVDRVAVRYAALDRLVGDLRRMGCTNILAERDRRPLTRAALAEARLAFSGNERFDLLHFAAWAPIDGEGDVNPAVGTFA